jgi:transcriptional regulator with GAF, ATPase, and Fis domain
MPPLRERREDIPLLVNYFIDKISKRLGKDPLRLVPVKRDGRVAELSLARQYSRT